MKKRISPLVNLLPRPAALALQRASETPDDPRDPLAKIKAIEQATAKIKRDYPQHFKKD